MEVDKIVPTGLVQLADGYLAAAADTPATPVLPECSAGRI